MGDRKLRRQLFFAQHPNCCFCAGDCVATTEDHQPGRVFFKERQWPEGFVFPACKACNEASAASEKLMAVLIHGEADSDGRQSFQKLLSSVTREYPELLTGMVPKSANEIRSILKAKSLMKPVGLTYAEVPIVKLDSDFWAPHLDLFSRKIMLALHYQLFSKPLSRSGVIWAYQHSNVDFMVGEAPEAFIEVTNNFVEPMRHKQLLSDQFSVRWASVPEHQTALFVAQFHSKFAISGVTTEEPERLTAANMPIAMHPFSWT